MNIKLNRKMTVAFGLIVVLGLVGIVVLIAGLNSDDESTVAAKNVETTSGQEPLEAVHLSHVPAHAGVSGPVEQGDAGFGPIAFPSLWREAGVSGPVEQGDAGFGPIAFPSLWREAGVSGPVEQGDAGFGPIAFPSLWREAGVSGPVEQGDAGFQQ